jgi:hypothetical protein
MRLPLPGQKKTVSAPDHISKSEAENIAKDVLKNGKTL